MSTPRKGDLVSVTYQGVVTHVWESGDFDYVTNAGKSRIHPEGVDAEITIIKRAKRGFKDGTVLRDLGTNGRHLTRHRLNGEWITDRGARWGRHDDYYAEKVDAGVFVIELGGFK